MIDKIWFGKRIAACDGIILEIGTGPGGGFMPYIPQANPDAKIIISDLSPTVVREWKRFLDGTRNFPNLYYTAFDFCKMPFKDDTIDIISDGGDWYTDDDESEIATLARSLGVNLKFTSYIRYCFKN